MLIFCLLFEAIVSDMKYIYKHYVASSDDSSIEEDYADATTMMQAVLANAEWGGEHVLNFKGFDQGPSTELEHGACVFDTYGCLVVIDSFFTPLQ